METILVTGGACLVGNHILGRLVNINGVKPITVLKPERQGFPLQQGVEIFYTDLRKTKNLERLFDTRRPNAVIHTAAKSGVGESLRKPLDYEENNVRVTLSLLELARKYGTKKFIFTSTGQVYNIESPSPFSEETPADKQDSPYASSKRACELFCYTYSETSDISVVCLRLGNIYGPGMRKNMVIQQLAEKAFSNEPFTMHGDGTAARDYLHVSDLVDAIILVLQLDSKFEVLNISSGRSTEVNDLIGIVERITERKIRTQRVEGNTASDKRLYMDISKAKRVLSWQPRVSLEEGLRTYIQWYTQNISS